ncbi:MAG: YCF48-related protein, partial [bacterium]|nr:YCF48-related protein [bacterium]
GGILESFNGGYSWEYLDKRLPIKAKENLRCFFLRVSPFDKNLIFGSIEADDKIKTNLFSKDAGKSWKKMNLKDNLDSGSIMLFTEDLIYLGSSTGNLFISKDSGENWEKLKFNIEGLVK